MNTPLTPAEQFRADVMSMLDAMHTELEDMRTELAQIREGLSHAASPAPAAQIGTFIATAIEHERAKGKDTFKMTGPKYAKFGVRVWPEVLEALGFKLQEIAGQDRTEISPPIEVRVELTTYTDEDGQIHPNSPKKVLGRA